MAFRFAYLLAEVKFYNTRYMFVNIYFTLFYNFKKRGKTAVIRHLFYITLYRVNSLSLSAVIRNNRTEIVKDNQ